MFVSNFKIIRLSFAVLLLSSLVILTTSIVYCTVYNEWNNIIAGIGVAIVFLLGTMGQGMYESNAIQFGMGQMIEQSSEQLSSFVHWYFWCANVGPLLMSFVIIVLILFSSVISFQVPKHLKEGNYIFGMIMIVYTLINLLLTLVTILLLFLWRHSFCIEQITRNPLKIIYKVLRYSYQHKYPERRSAFTYWENDIPSRINLGKEKYGGPFTYEQVEDVKTVFRLLLLMVSMFGFHLSGDGYSLSNYIINTMGCPPLTITVFMLMNPRHMSLIVISLGIPLCKLLKKSIFFKKFFNSCLLSRLKIGLLICLVNEVTLCVYCLIIPDTIRVDCIPFDSKQLLQWCLEVNLKIIQNNTIDPCITYSTSGIVYLSAIPFILKGFAYLLVFVTMVEFICAQCPNSMKGLLIGLWYSSLFVNYAVVNVLDIWLQRIEQGPWSIYHGVKGFLIFISICLFMLVSRRYQFRQRNEVVGEQNIIEKLYERELLLNSSVESS